MNIILLFLGFILVENTILAKFLKISPLFDDSKKEKDNFVLALFVIIDITLSSLITYVIYKNFLTSISNDYVKTIIFFITITFFTLMLHIIIKKYRADLYNMLFNYELAILNCAILGLVLLSTQSDYTLTNVLTYSFFSTIGYVISIYVFESIKEKIARAPIVKPLRGLPIAFITIFIIILIFYSYI